MSPAARLGPLVHVSVLELLRRHPGGLDLGDLAARFGLDRERMRRVVVELWTLGLHDADGREIPGENFDFDADALDDDWVRLTYDPVGTAPVRFGAAERVMVVAGLEVLRAGAGDAEAALLDRLAAKLRDERDPATPGAASTGPRLRALGDAIARGERLRLHYRGEFAERAEWREVDPLRLELRPEGEYLNAWCRTRGGPRWFRADRILAAEPTGEPADAHDEAVRQRPLEVRAPGSVRVELVVAPSAFAAIAPYLPAGRRLRPDADGLARATVSLRSWRVAARLVAEHAGAVRVAGPAEARRAVADWAREALAATAPDAAGRASGDAGRADGRSGRASDASGA
ncbi:MAG: WYL domain-containing protein [Microbacteriaceae bacterium]|nr:WYL domain-containing protein [Microbacteriaceae bacterium]